MQKLPDLPIGSTKAALQAAEAGKANLTLLNPAVIHAYPGLQPRYDNGAYQKRLGDLVDSMVETGYLASKPLTVWVGKDDDGNNTIYVVDGHTRLAAVKQAIERGADIGQVPTIVLPSTTTMEQVIAMTVKENENPGQKLDPLEKALSVKRLMNRGLPEDEIMKLLGFGEKWFRKIVLLIDAPKFIREAIKNGRIAGTLALDIIEDAVRKNAKKIEKDHPKGMKAAYDLAEKEVKAAIDDAARSGKERATKKNTSAGTRGGRSTRETETDAETGEQKPRMITEKTAPVALATGDEFKLSEWRVWTQLFGSDWYKLHEDRAGYAVATEDVEFNASIKHPVRADAPDKKDEAAEDEAADAETEDAEAEEELEGADL